MANIVIKPPVDKTAMPLKAAPLVQPRANCAPKPKNVPPIKATINRFLEVIPGACCTKSFSLPLKAPDKNHQLKHL